VWRSTASASATTWLLASANTETMAQEVQNLDKPLHMSSVLHGSLGYEIRTPNFRIAPNFRPNVGASLLSPPADLTKGTGG
jgi:hypothetical protein